MKDPILESIEVSEHNSCYVFRLNSLGSRLQEISEKKVLTTEKVLEIFDALRTQTRTRNMVCLTRHLTMSDGGLRWMHTVSTRSCYGNVYLVIRIRIIRVCRMDPYPIYLLTGTVSCCLIH